MTEQRNKASVERARRHLLPRVQGFKVGQQSTWLNPELEQPLNHQPLGGDSEATALTSMERMERNWKA